MIFKMEPLSCDPARIKGMSERLILSHYENNYGGAVKRLNVIEEKLAELDYAKAPGFLINGLKREQLVAMNSMVLHELFSTGLVSKANQELFYVRRLHMTLDRMSAGGPNLPQWGRPSVAARAGYCCRGRRATENLSTNGHLTIATRLPAAGQFSRSTCMSTRITSTLARSRPPTWILLWQRSVGTTVINCSAGLQKTGVHNRAMGPPRRLACVQ